MNRGRPYLLRGTIGIWSNWVLKVVLPAKDEARENIFLFARAACGGGSAPGRRALESGGGARVKVHSGRRRAQVAVAVSGQHAGGRRLRRRWPTGPGAADLRTPAGGAGDDCYGAACFSARVLQGSKPLRQSDSRDQIPTAAGADCCCASSSSVRCIFVASKAFYAYYAFLVKIL
jgi:hypothetical protein